MLTPASVLRAVELHIRQGGQWLRVRVGQCRGLARRLLGLVQLASGNQRVGVIGLRGRIVGAHVGHLLLRVRCAGAVALLDGDGCERRPHGGSLRIELSRLAQMRLGFFDLVPEEESRRGDTDVSAPVARRQLEQLQL